MRHAEHSDARKIQSQGKPDQHSMGLSRQQSFVMGSLLDLAGATQMHNAKGKMVMHQHK